MIDAATGSRQRKDFQVIPEEFSASDSAPVRRYPEAVSGIATSTNAKPGEDV